MKDMDWNFIIFFIHSIFVDIVRINKWMKFKQNK